MRLLLSALFVLLLGSEASAYCRVPTFHMPNGGLGEGRMETTSAQDCRIGTFPLNSESFSFTQRPRNGTVRVVASGLIAYKSRSGFSGEDSFSYTHTGYDDFRVKVVRRGRVTVTVTP